MRRKTRQGNSTERKRINPGVTYKTTTFHALYKRPVKVRIMRQNGHATNKISELLNRLSARRRIKNVSVGDVRQLGNFFWNKFSGVHKGRKPVDNLALFDASCSYLDKLTGFKR